MNIVFFTHNIKQGGLDTFIVNLISAWPAATSIVLFCNRSHPGLLELQSRLTGRAVVIPYDFWTAQDLNNLMLSKPRLIGFGARTLFWIFGFPYLIYQTGKLFKLHSFDRLMVINGGYPGGDACLAATISWWLNGNQHRAWHNFHNLVLPYPSQLLRKLKEKLIDRYVAYSAAGFVTVSKACMQTLNTRPQFFSTVRRTFIYNGVLPTASRLDGSLIAELGLPLGSSLILMLAVYEPRKGHAFIIRAMDEIVRRVPGAVLLVCGDGTCEEQRAVELLRADSAVGQQIILQGHRGDVSNLLLQSKVLVLPSQAQESFGYVAVEAMAHGCPVVVTDVGGLPEVVEDGISGYVVAHSNEKAFAEKVISILEDGDLRNRMGQAGKKRYQNHFSASYMASRYFNLMVGDKGS